MALVVRREFDDAGAKTRARGKARLRRYLHLGTGNYHPGTARLYTDFGLMTADEGICADVNDIFVQLTGLGRATKLAQVWQAPFTLHSGVMAAIEQEIKHARSGKRARIIAKMNSLVEPEVIRLLYRASNAGVSIDLIVRGMCTLRPGVAGLSENIRVRSIVGRFLEHSRIFYFRNGGAGKEIVMLSSADWMERNFFRRIELCFPVKDARLKKRVIAEGLMPYLNDNVQAWQMDENGGYLRLRPSRVSHTPRAAKARVSAQEDLLRLLGEA